MSTYRNSKYDRIFTLISVLSRVIPVISADYDYEKLIYIEIRP